MKDIWYELLLPIVVMVIIVGGFIGLLTLYVYTQNGYLFQ
jgi:hypothetical protein